MRALRRAPEMRNPAVLLAAWICLGGAAWAASTAPDAPEARSRWVAGEAGVVEDRQTGLQWTRQDNGSDLDWDAARRYCLSKRQGWRLPEIEELASLYRKPVAGADHTGPDGVACGGSICRVASLFRLGDSWFWSSTVVGPDGSDGTELAWGLQLSNGARTQSVMVAGFGRALCVRRP